MLQGPLLSSLAHRHTVYVHVVLPMWGGGGNPVRTCTIGEFLLTALFAIVDLYFQEVGLHKVAS